MWNILHTFRYRGRTFVQIVSMRMRMRTLESAFAAEAEYANTLGSGFDHIEIEAVRSYENI